MVRTARTRELAWFEIWSTPLVLEEQGASMYNVWGMVRWKEVRIEVKMEAGAGQ